MRNHAEELTWILRLGVYQPMSVFRTPQLLRAFQQDHHDVVVDVREDGQERLVELFIENRVDIVVSYSVIDFAQWEVETLTKIPPHAIVSRKNKLATKNIVTLEELVPRQAALGR